jgi:hypothetical protein
MPTGDPTPQEQKWLALKAKYGGRYLDKRMQWLDWADKPLPTGKAPKDLAMNAAKGYNLSAGDLLASAMEEGIGNRYQNDYSEAYSNANQKGELKDYGVDGFRSYGLDTFGGRYPELVQQGYLKPEFAQTFKPYRAQNEKGEWVQTAAFKDDDSAMQAKAALMAQERDKLNKYVEKKGVKLTPEESRFFTLASYNGGLGNAQQMLDYYQGKGLIGNNGFLKDRMSAKGQVYDNVMPRYYGGNLFEGEGYFQKLAPVPVQTAEGGVKGYKKNADGDLIPVF